MGVLATANDKRESLPDLRTRWRFSYSRIKSDRNAAPYVQQFAAFEPQWMAANLKEMAHDDAIADAEANAVTTDQGLDGLVRRVSSGIFGGAKVDVEVPLARVYFASVAPSAFARPILGKQLTRMATWPALLSKAPQEPLAALAPMAAAVVPAAESAAKALSAAIADREFFAKGGERKAIFDAFNAIAATAYGGLKAFAHSHPELGLPVDYAESFFVSTTASSQPKSVDAANIVVARLEEKLALAKQLQAELVQAAADQAAQQQEYDKALTDEGVAKKKESEAHGVTKAAKATTKKSKPKKKAAKKKTVKKKA